MSLNDVPDIRFVETDTNIIFNNMKTKFESEIGRFLYPGDPLLILIQTFVAIVSQQASLLEYVAKQNLVKYSDNGFIENLGALVGVSRLQPANALVTLKFTISETQNHIITVPAGTRVTTGNKIYFETKDTIEIYPGEVEGLVNGECQEKGVIGNNFALGQINQIVDIFPYFKSVENITVSNSGSDIESLESFRNRIFEAPKSYSVAGPEAAYKFWAKSTNALISDVSVFSPTPGIVELIPLLENGVIPSEEILKEVYDFCSADERRPLTDFVEVLPPIIKEYKINLQYFILRNNASSINQIKNNVDKSVNEFILWQKTILGRDINPSKLTELLIQAGAKRVEILEPVFTNLKYKEVAVCTDIICVFGGLEDE